MKKRTGKNKTLKYTVCLICLLLLSMPLLVLCADAEQSQDATPPITEATDAYLTRFFELVPSSAGEVSDTETLLSAVGIEQILTMLATTLTDAGAALWPFLCLLFGACICMRLIPEGEEGFVTVIRAATSAVFAVSVYEKLQGVVDVVYEGADAAVIFFNTLIPLFGAVTLAGGAETTGAVQTAAMGLTVHVLQLCLRYVLMPLTSFLFALGLIGVLGDGGGARTLCDQVKRLFLWGVGLLSTLLIAAVGLQSVLASSADTVAMRTVKYTVSGMLPIVGNTVSGALSTLTTGLLYVKSAVGAGAVTVLLSLLLPPLVTLALYRLAIGICLSFWRFVDAERAVPLLGAFSGALDVVLAVGSLSGVLLILETVFFMKSGVALLL